MRDLDSNPSYFKGSDPAGISSAARLVERVTWDDAVECCKRLSNYTGRMYRLPSEAEWEYACRAGTTTPFHFGETISTELANYDGSKTYGNGQTGVYRQETTPVGRFGVANAFGLYDMHGNGWEWCLDHWHDSYQGAPVDGSAWIAGESSDLRVLRGGSWFFPPVYCRSASRNGFGSRNDNNNVGFRVVCVSA